MSSGIGMASSKNGICLTYNHKHPSSCSSRTQTAKILTDSKLSCSLHASPASINVNCTTPEAATQVQKISAQLQQYQSIMFRKGVESFLMWVSTSGHGSAAHTPSLPVVPRSLRLPEGRFLEGCFLKGCFLEGCFGRLFSGGPFVGRLLDGGPLASGSGTVTVDTTPMLKAPHPGHAVMSCSIVSSRVLRMNSPAACWSLPKRVAQS